jgi:hypothetical protein
MSPRTAVTLDSSMGTEAEAIQSSPRFFPVSIMLVRVSDRMERSELLVRMNDDEKKTFAEIVDGLKANV